jgi:predicted CxxxxCH...CXXCH cytochrome family protein
VAVDPYIFGAVFQEVAPDGVTVLQRQSTPSDANGVFTFPAPLTTGSTVEMKIANKGLHGGAPFQGMLRRVVRAGDAGSLTVTPLTTLLANGVQPADALQTLNNAGFTGLSSADLYANPMNGLTNLTGNFSDQQLRLLQAAMAVESYMEITGNFKPTINDLTNPAQTQILNSMGDAVRSTLSSAEFTRITKSLAGDPQMSSPLTLGDLIVATVQQQQTLVSLARTDMAAHGYFDPAQMVQNVTNGKGQIATMAKNQSMARMPIPTLAAGAVLYAANCAGCHSALASSSKKGRTAAQIQAAINANLGNMGSLSSLNSGEVQAIADALVTSIPPAPKPTDGPTLYTTNCAGCHSALASTTKKGRTATDIQNAISKNIGNMGYLTTLTTAEIQAIANALPAAPPTNPATPPDGVALYNSECAGCHGPLATTAKKGRTAAQIQTAITKNLGNMGYLTTLTTAEIQAIANALPAAPPPPATPPTGAALYGSNCAGCHGALASTTKAGRTAAQIQSAINNNVGNMGYLFTLTSAEIQAIAGALPAAPPPPATPPSGATLYTTNCAGCHGPLAATSKPGRTAAQIQTAISNNVGNMGYLSTLTSAEIQAIAGALPAAPPPPATPPSGATLYTNNCAGCHGPLATSSKAGRTAAQIQTAINNNVGNMGYLSTLTSTEIQAIASALPAAPPPPATPPSGATLYTNNCAGCHGPLASTNKPGRTAAQIQTAITNNTGGMGYLATLTSAEIQAIASALPAAPPGGPNYTDCTACHGQPPSGNSYPNVAGHHAEHTTLPSINNNCATCHAAAAHNGTVDLGIVSTFNAKSGPAMANANMTCTNISCHGGQTTPNWQSGSIAVDTQCTSCHAAGTSQYNSYFSGQHNRHVSRGFSCTVCHDTGKLANGHFTNLATSNFEQDPAATIGGGSTSVGSYTPSTTRATSGTCSSIACHGSESW